MVNKTGGKKHKKYKKNRDADIKKKLIKKSEGEEYAYVIDKKGGPILGLRLLDDRMVLGVIRGKMRKRVWINPGDIILVSIRGFQDNKVDVIAKYTDDEVRKLIKQKEVTRKFTLNLDDDDESNKNTIFLENSDSDEESEEEVKKTLAKDKVSYKKLRTQKITAFDFDSI